MELIDLPEDAFKVENQEEDFKGRHVLISGGWYAKSKLVIAKIATSPQCQYTEVQVENVDERFFGEGATVIYDEQSGINVYMLTWLENKVLHFQLVKNADTKKYKLKLVEEKDMPEGSTMK